MNAEAGAPKIDTRRAFTRENYSMMRELLCLFLHYHSIYAQQQHPKAI